MTLEFSAASGPGNVDISSDNAYESNSDDIELWSGNVLETRSPGTSRTLQLITSTVIHGNLGDITLALGSSKSGKSGNTTLEAVSHLMP